jgi:hypothetical protein
MAEKSIIEGGKGSIGKNQMINGVSSKLEMQRLQKHKCDPGTTVIG